MDKFYIKTTDARFVFNEDGFKITDYEPNNFRGYPEPVIRCGNLRRKARGRVKRLPIWCCNALDEGKWIEVSGVEFKGEYPNNYIIIRGKAVTPMLKEETTIEISSCCGGDIYQENFELEVTKVYKGYADEWDYVETRRKDGKTIAVITTAEYERFKTENPLPKEDITTSKSFLRKKYTYSMWDGFAKRYETDIYSVKKTGCYYGYSLDKNLRPFIERHDVNWDCTDEDVEMECVILAYISKTLIRTYRTESWSELYESNDGMRMERTRYDYENKDYRVTLSDGTEHILTIRKLVNAC